MYVILAVGVRGQRGMGASTRDHLHRDPGWRLNMLPRHLLQSYLDHSTSLSHAPTHARIRANVTAIGIAWRLLDVCPFRRWNHLEDIEMLSDRSRNSGSGAGCKKPARTFCGFLMHLLYILKIILCSCQYKTQSNKYNINPLKTKRRLLYLKTQFVPRSKHFSSRL